MARDGMRSVLQASRRIRRVIGRFGVAGVATRLGGDMATAVTTLTAVLAALEALDDYLQVIDRNPEPGEGAQNDGDTTAINYGNMGSSSGTFGGGVSQGTFGEPDPE